GRAHVKGPHGKLTVEVHDGVGGPLVPARVLFWDGDEPLHFGNLDYLGGKRQVAGVCTLGPGVLAGWHGLMLAHGSGEVPIDGGDGCEPSPALPGGRYRVWAWRGFEYDLWQGEVEVKAGKDARLDIALVRAWDPGSALAADLHVHAAMSNDSQVPMRVRAITQAVSGLRVTALSDHAASGDLDQAIVDEGLEPWLASIASNEAGNDTAHYGVYPVPVDPEAPRGGSPDAAAMSHWTPAQAMAWGHGLAGHPLVQINHPRFRVYALFDTTGWDGVTWPPPFPLDFDAVEVLAGHTAFNVAGDRRIDEGVRDFYTMIGHGLWVTGVGTSDVHHLSGVLDGVARTYVFVDDPRTQPFDEPAFVAAVRAHRAVATTGPWLDVEVAPAGGGAAAGPGQTVHAPGGQVTVDVELAQANFIHADHLRVLVGGQVVRTEALDPDEQRHRLTLTVPVTPPTWIGVDAGGDTPLPVELTGTYQLEKGRAGVTPFAIINPVRVEK
ncbi:MAG TPA: CehA/McbA family metallohydrolase, partial [Kofleriaceae bacterium]|nr:CehA/McbA family metallohydrolase [Kofleriaceae bacterium]